MLFHQIDHYCKLGIKNDKFRPFGTPARIFYHGEVSPCKITLSWRSLSNFLIVLKYYDLYYKFLI